MSAAIFPFPNPRPRSCRLAVLHGRLTMRVVRHRLMLALLRLALGGLRR